MATKSILKTIEITDKSIGARFASALEQSDKLKGKQVDLSKKCTELKGDSVKEFFQRKK